MRPLLHQVVPHSRYVAYIILQGLGVKYSPSDSPLWLIKPNHRGIFMFVPIISHLCGIGVLCRFNSIEPT